MVVSLLLNSMLVLTSAAHILKLEQYREDEHGKCARMTSKFMKHSIKKLSSMLFLFHGCNVFSYFNYTIFIPSLYHLFSLKITLLVTFWSSLHFGGFSQMSDP